VEPSFVDNYAVIDPVRKASSIRLAKRSQRGLHNMANSYRLHPYFGRSPHLYTVSDGKHAVMDEKPLPSVTTNPKNPAPCNSGRMRG